VTEIDPGGMVLEGGVAAFDIHLDTGANGVTGPVMAWYNTVDGSGHAGTDYDSGGAGAVTFAPGETDSIVYVQTRGGFNDGTDKRFSLQLTHQYDGNADPGWSGAAAGSATATIVRPEVTITAPAESAGSITLPDDGSRVELDLHVEIDAAYAALHPDTVSVPSIAGVSFYTSETGGTALASNSDGDVIEQNLSSGATYTAVIWAAVDPMAPSTSPVTITLVANAQGGGAATAVLPAKKSLIQLLEAFINTDPSVSPYTIFALNYLKSSSVARSTKYMWWDHYDVSVRSIVVSSEFNGFTQGTSWFEDAVRAWAYCDSADYFKMVQSYALADRAIPGTDVVKVVADTCSFAQYWTKAFSTNPTGSMPGPSQMATAILYAFTGCTTSWSAAKWAAAGTTPPPVAMSSTGMSEYYCDMTGRHLNDSADQTHHFAFYFQVGFDTLGQFVPAAGMTGSVLGQKKFPTNNPGDCLLACEAASIGSAYKANPKLDFQTALGALRSDPQMVTTGGADFWNLGIREALRVIDKLDY
jgi:hypothetical protein